MSPRAQLVEYRAASVIVSCNRRIRNEYVRKGLCKHLYVHRVHKNKPKFFGSNFKSC